MVVLQADDSVLARRGWRSVALAHPVQRAVDFVGKGNLFTGCHDARPGLERSETPEFFNMAHPTLRGFLKTSMPIGFVVLNQRL